MVEDESESGIEWTKRDVVYLLDRYIGDLRILGRRFENSVLPTEMFCLPEVWSEQDHDQHSLYDFELAGIKASGYPEVFTRTASAEYACPNSFVEFVSDSLKNSADGAVLTQQWCLLPAEAIALHPRYVAFRTAYEWVILHAKVLAEDRPGETLDLSDRIDPFETALPNDDPDEPVGLIAGNPLRLADGGFRNQWNPSFAGPWHEVNDHIEAIHYFHFRGTFLLQDLRRWPHQSPERQDPGLLPLELLTPQAFTEFVAMRIVQDQNSIAFHMWHDRPPEEVECDPRYIAYRCAFDREMILRMACRPAESEPPSTESQEMLKEFGFEGLDPFFGETVDDDKPN